MIYWPWSKKKDPPAFPKTSVQPPENFMRQFSEGKGNCAWLIPYEYVNWAYEYLGRDDRVYEYGEILNGHILHLTYACIKFLEENKMTKVNPDKMHDSIMNNIEWLVELDYLEYCGTEEYTYMSEAIYKFCLAYSGRDFKERE